MIVFDGYLSGDAKTTCIKSKLHNGSKLPVIFLLFSVPIWAFLAYKTDTLLPVMCSLFIMIILSPFVFRLLISKKSQEHMNLKNPACIIDSNHSNSNKQYEQQIRIVKEVMHSRKLCPDIHKLVKGVMVESYIEPGCQKVGGGVYGKSITDPCLGWEDTEKLIYSIAEFE